MRLIGRYDSPFVRRVGISLHLLGLPFEQLPLSVFSDAAEVRKFSPLGRVPVLVLADGESWSTAQPSSITSTRWPGPNGG